MASARDPSNYYGLLKIKPGASADDIKSAYRKRARELHPDTNRHPKAAEQFHKLQEAYDVLGDAKRRATYDQYGNKGADALKKFRDAARKSAQRQAASQRKAQRKTAAQGERTKPPPKSKPSPGKTDTKAPPRPEPKAEASAFPPIACSACQKVTAQPRFAEYTAVRAKAGKAERLIFDGIFCRDCADKVALRASLMSWAAGWWAWPAGPKATIGAIWQNMKGGFLPRARNARLLLEQARAFKARDDIRLARDLAGQALGFAQDEATRQEITAFISSLSRHLANAPKARLKNRWRSPGLMPFLHLAPAAIIIAIFSMAIAASLG